VTDEVNLGVHVSEIEVEMVVLKILAATDYV
jgi:hypothetical protein